MSAFFDLIGQGSALAFGIYAAEGLLAPFQRWKDVWKLMRSLAGTETEEAPLARIMSAAKTRSHGRFALSRVLAFPVGLYNRSPVHLTRTVDRSNAYKTRFS